MHLIPKISIQHLSGRIAEVAKFHTSIGITGFAINTCYNKDFYDKLPADLKDLFYNTQEPLAMAATKVSMFDFNKTALATYKERGVEMITLAPAELQRWRDFAAPTVDKWAADLEKDGQPAKALLADLKRLTEKYGRMSPDELGPSSSRNCRSLPPGLEVRHRMMTPLSAYWV